MSSITASLLVKSCGNKDGNKPLTAALKNPTTTATSMIRNANSFDFLKFPS